MSRIRLATLLLCPLFLVGSCFWKSGLWSSGFWSKGFGAEPSTELYAEHPPLGHTGGFGEPSCHSCHFGGEVNSGGGSLSVEGLPTSVSPDHRYQLTVKLTARMKRSGFMLSVRHADGTQAGRIVAHDTTRVAIGTPDTSTVQYAHHTLAGTSLSRPGQAVWSVRWIAPNAVGDTVLVHVAANAANDDASKFGDDIYTSMAKAIVAQ